MLFVLAPQVLYAFSCSPIAVKLFGHNRKQFLNLMNWARKIHGDHTTVSLFARLRILPQVAACKTDKERLIGTDQLGARTIWTVGQPASMIDAGQDGSPFRDFVVYLKAHTASRIDKPRPVSLSLDPRNFVPPVPHALFHIVCLWHSLIPQYHCLAHLATARDAESPIARYICRSQKPSELENVAGAHFDLGPLDEEVLV